MYGPAVRRKRISWVCRLFGLATVRTMGPGDDAFMEDGEEEETDVIEIGRARRFE